MSLTASVFIEEDTSPMVDTNNSRSSAPFEIIRIGDLTIFAGGEDDRAAVGYWDRLRRAALEAGERAQRRIDAAEPEPVKPLDLDRYTIVPLQLWEVLPVVETAYHTDQRQSDVPR